MKATRRAMLLALGVDVTDIPVAELEKPTAATIGDADEWEVREVTVQSLADSFEVTTHGDAQRRYVAGPARQRVHLVVTASEAALAARASKVGPLGMPELQLEDVVGDMRLSARLLVVSCHYGYSAMDRFVTATFECEVVGQIAFSPVVPLKSVAAGRRGMAL